MAKQAAAKTDDRAAQRGARSVAQRAVSELIPYANNARTHSEAQVAQIASSIREFGFNNPVLVDGGNGIIAGHGRVLAAAKLGLQKVPVIELTHLSDAQKRAYILADNRLAENAGWDRELLALELGDLADLGLDLGEIGFDGAELDALLGHPQPQPGRRDDAWHPEAGRMHAAPDAEQLQPRTGSLRAVLRVRHHADRGREFRPGLLCHGTGRGVRGCLCPALAGLLGTCGSARRRWPRLCRDHRRTAGSGGMSQTRRMSALEAASNVVVGWLVAANKAMADMVRYAAEFGLTPSARVRICAEGRDIAMDDPAAEFF